MNIKTIAQMYWLMIGMHKHPPISVGDMPPTDTKTADRSEPYTYCG